MVGYTWFGVHEEECQNNVTRMDTMMWFAATLMFCAVMLLNFCNLFYGVWPVTYLCMTILLLLGLTLVWAEISGFRSRPDQSKLLEEGRQVKYRRRLWWGIL